MATLPGPHYPDPRCDACRELLIGEPRKLIEADHLDGYDVVQYDEPQPSPFVRRMRQVREAQAQLRRAMRERRDSR